MKTILYNPIFINPQAYYVFPRLTRYLQPDNESTAEPANYIGTIEVKVIAYGDTTLKRTYTNTDSIDLSEFKNTWIRISLFTKVGSCVLGEWKIGNMESDLPYIDPEVLASLKAVVIVGNKTNNDSDRAIVKNLVDPDNPFVISNAAYDKMSSYGGYEFAKFDNTLDWYNTEGNDSVEVVSRNGHSITLKRLTGPNFWYFQNSTFRGLISNVIPFKVNSNKNITVIWDVHGLSISEGKDKSVRIQELVLNPNEDNYTNLKTLNEEELAQIDISTNSLYYLLWFDLSTLAVDEEVTIEMLPLFEGAFVTDGIDDLITSTKTVQEMLGGSNEITVVSMIHQVKDSSNNVSFTNYIRGSANGYFRNIVNNYDKTGIYGYTSSDLMGLSVVNNILGDKNDYTSNGDNRDSIINGNFSVQGYSYNDGNNTGDFSSVAWYWTIIANKVLTTDQINQVIAYFNLDRTLKPDILCNVKKQGITNENHAEFGDKLIDYSGNGRDIQLNNIAWKGDSGIGKYEVDFASLNYNNTISIFTATYKSCSISKIIKDSVGNIFYNWGQTLAAINSTKIQVIGLDEIGAILEFTYLDESSNSTTKQYSTDGIYDLPASAAYQGDSYNTNFRFSIRGYIGDCDITITQIPSHAGALYLDGVNDFGKVTGMPVYKDYTVVTDREIFANIGAISSKNNPGAFVETSGNSVYSFGQGTSGLNFISTRSISYLSKYSYCGQSITVGAAEDGTDMWLGTIRDNDSRFFNGAIYSLMTFPYSMSEFLIERQLKKHKLGTLYPDMVEFRPIVKSNVKWDIIEIWQGDKSLYRPAVNDDKTGIYLKKDSTIGIYVKPYVGQKVSEIVYNGVSYTDLKLNSNGFYYKVVPITKSPQKIGITIEQDENYVLFNPVINSNYDNYKLTFHLREYEKLINIGDYIPKGTYIRANLYLKNNIDELVTFTFNGVNIDYAKSPVLDTAYNIRQIYNYDSPQEVNITIDEYIRYEDIVQPYPVIFQITDRNTNQRYSWGDKIKVGSSIRLSQGEKPNLLSGLYSIKSYEYEGETYSYNQLTNLNIILTKQSISLSCNKTWLLDDNEPKCILSPRLLRIPNSSYKILGYIPDISGHGNHGKINNSAYAGMSGVNGYPVVFGANKTWTNESNGYVTSITSNTIHITNVLNAGLALLYSYVKYNGNLQNIKEIPPFKIEIKGLEGRSKFIYKYLATSDATKETNLYLGNGTHELPKSFLPTEALINNAVVGFSISPIEEGVTNFLSDITIKVLPKYEGAYCLDGVDDFVTIPTTVGGKQVLMKVNQDSSNSALLYDQRGYNNEFAIYNGSVDSDGNPIPAYQGRNNGQTYIDGILNSNIKASELRAITHNITITNELSAGVNKFSPVIGSNRVHNAYFTNMALYDFMLFDNISTDDKIKQLNEYVGIEGNTEWRKTK